MCLQVLESCDLWLGDSAVVARLKEGFEPRDLTIPREVEGRSIAEAAHFPAWEASQVWSMKLTSDTGLAEGRPTAVCSLSKRAGWKEETPLGAEPIDLDRNEVAVGFANGAAAPSEKMPWSLLPETTETRSVVCWTLRAFSLQGQDFWCVPASEATQALRAAAQSFEANAPRAHPEGGTCYASAKSLGSDCHGLPQDRRVLALAHPGLLQPGVHHLITSLQWASKHTAAIALKSMLAPL